MSTECSNMNSDLTNMNSEELLKMRIEINKNIFYLKDKLKIINKLIKKTCKHQWVEDCTGGPYSERYNYCTICNYMK